MKKRKYLYILCTGLNERALLPAIIRKKHESIDRYPSIRNNMYSVSCTSQVDRAVLYKVSYHIYIQSYTPSVVHI